MSTYISMFFKLFDKDYGTNVLDYIGFLGPILLLFISIFKLWNQPPYWRAYLVMFFINSAINQVLKLWIRQERPTGGQTIMGEPYSGANVFGMPSAHTQSIFFSLTYLYLVKRSNTILIIELFIALLTIYQRFKYKQHTMEQLCIGAVIGIGIAYLGWLSTNEIIKKKFIDFRKI